MDINKHIIVGHLGADPKIQQNDGGYYGGLNVGTKDSWVNAKGERQEWTDWHRVVVRDSIAEIALTLKKGSMVYVCGKSRKRKWTNEEGVVLTVTEIIAEELVPMSSVQSQQAHQTQQPQRQKQQSQPQRPQQQQKSQTAATPPQEDWVTNPSF